ncbi:amino acid ABC transporter permease [Devosia riboflavina]|uniref:amino acid ABC transporter permease n=1 Tax=Devosia riboflavina TaxID=46914 RepID=UPI00126A4999|nr:amino acid ABC transporter permease [Devosia riboflavina]
MSEDTAAPTAYRIIHRPRYGTLIAACIAGFLALSLIVSIGGNANFQWEAVGHYLFHPAILRGLAITLALTAVVLLIATLLGTAVALMRLSSSRILATIALVYVWIFRGVPALIQLIFWFNLGLVIREISVVLPGFGTLFTLNTNDVLSPYTAAVIALSLCEAAYMAEIVRAGILSVPVGQEDAARSLGMSRRQAFWRIVAPQALSFVIPPTGNAAISLLKLTSLVTYVAVDDLFYAAQSIYARTFETIPLLVVVAFWYLAVVTVMSIGQGFLEAHFGQFDRRSRRSWSLPLRQAGAGLRNLWRAQ